MFAAWGAIVTNAEPRGALGVVGIRLVVFLVLLAGITSLGHISGALGGHDSRRTRVSLASRDTIGGWDAQRLRSNMLLDGGGEDALVGSHVQLGEAALDVTKQIGRCVMVPRAQAGGIERDLDVLRTIARERDTFPAIAALVADPEQVGVGDSVAPWTSP